MNQYLAFRTAYNVIKECKSDNDAIEQAKLNFTHPNDLILVCKESKNKYMIARVIEYKRIDAKSIEDASKTAENMHICKIENRIFLDLRHKLIK